MKQVYIDNNNILWPEDIKPNAYVIKFDEFAKIVMAAFEAG
jgi:hypothetical protein